MRISEVLLDERIDDNTTVIIKDLTGRPIICGRWYEDKIFAFDHYDVSYDFVEERNIAILQIR